MKTCTIAYCTISIDRYFYSAVVALNSGFPFWILPQDKLRNGKPGIEAGVVDWFSLDFKFKFTNYLV